MAQQFGPQAQRATAQQTLINAVDAFRNLLSPAEIVDLSQTNTPGDILELTKGLKDERVSEKKIKRCEAFLQSVQQFSRIVDTMIQHSPCISALVWGSVKLLLLTAQKYVRFFSCLTDLLEKLGMLCPIFKEFQDLWPHYKGLQDAVFEYYAQTVNFCSKTIAFLRKTSTSMIVRTLLKPLHNELQDVEKNPTIQQKIVEYQIILAREDAARRARQQQMLFNANWEELSNTARLEVACHGQLMQRLESSADRIEDRQLQQVKKVRDLELKQNTQKKFKERQRLLKQISDYNHTTTFLDLHNVSHPPTGEWLYEMDQYKEWVQAHHSSLLWCHGIPGSGKSVLSTSVVKHLLDTCVEQSNSGSGKTFIGYFFCNFSDCRSLKFEEIIRSLIKQMLSVFPGSTESEEYLVKFFDQYNNIPSIHQWQELLIYTCSLHKRIYLILDGIDECHDDNQVQILEFLNQILSIPRCIKIYLSSRKEVYLSRNLTDALSVSLDNIKCRPEIKGYIDASLKKCLDNKRLRIHDPAMIEEIKEALMGGVDGMFLWVTLQIQDICRGFNDEEIRETLQSLPRNLDETYIRMLERIVKARNKDIAVKAFQWLTTARRPLSLRELMEAVVIREDDNTQIEGLNRIPKDLDKVIEACGNFLVTEEPVCESSTVRFIHSTVVTFLHTYKLPTHLELFRIDQQTAEVNMAKKCLQYLHFQDLQTQLEPTTPVSVSKPRKSILSVPISQWTSPELQSNLVGSAAFRYVLTPPLEQHAPKKVNLKLFSPTSAKQESDSDVSRHQMHKSSLFEYISECWLNHCESLPTTCETLENKSQVWDWFRNLVFDGLDVIRLPWPTETPSTADDPHHERFKWAIQNSHEPLVQLIFQELALVDISSPQYVERFLARDSAGTKYEHHVSEMPLLVAAALGYPYLVNFFLSKGSQLDFEFHLRTTGEKETALMAASARGHLRTVKHILQVICQFSNY
ncbi:hypothetical protein BDZ91DRAFT_849422 [Kalaharituber pfeilii]|nr:hypothetical protein BDZ91DRAFT_849422 [Kalaharituber pfeilii]